MIHWAITTGNKKTWVPRPAHGKVLGCLKNLRLTYKEHEKKSNNYYISVPQFGIIFRFSSSSPSASHFNDWDIVDINPDEIELNSISFSEGLMWLLVEKGYMSFLRHGGASGNVVFNKLIQQGGWGLRIIDKRLEIWDNKPKYRYQIERNTRLKSYSVSYILTHYPDFFDTLV